MKCTLTIQEKLKDLRNERGLKLEELAQQTGLSRSALGSYESNDYKDISHTAIITLVRFYGVSTDYLLGLTQNRDEVPASISELRIDDGTADVLKSGKVNNRLLCELVKHPDFWKFMSDMEIYIDSIGGRAPQQEMSLYGYRDTACDNAICLFPCGCYVNVVLLSITESEGGQTDF